MNSRIVITRHAGKLLTVLFSAREAVELSVEEDSSILGNIYIGVVKTIVKNLNAAFVDLGGGRIGYYSLSDNPESLYASGGKGAARCGDEIIVQVAKDAVKSKDPVLTANLNFTGRFAVLTAGRHQIGFSSKIADRGWKEMLRPQLEELLGEEAGVIVRTNAYENEEALLEELTRLLEDFRRVKAEAPYRKVFSMLRESDPEYLKIIRNCPAGSLDDIVTDASEVYETVTGFFRQTEPEGIGKVRFYQDENLSLTSLYSLESVLERALMKRVWLKSGGYLVIEHTEAMTVIDVNSGKYAGKKSQEEAILLINLEAAREIAHQIRLRNLSGIIMVDFIDMKKEANRLLLLDTLRAAVRPDPVKTTVVDMTPLNLVEMTRKKEKKPLWEQLSHGEKG